jgi:alcohol dehydrogenase class IV
MLRFTCPTEIVFGEDAPGALAPPERRVLLLASRSLPDAVVDGLARTLGQAGCEVTPVRRGGGEPDSATVDAFAAGLKETPEAVVAVGGGSTLDFAKAVALVAASGGGIADYEFGARRAETALPLYLMPSTCGSGSEVTPYAVINNSETHRKFTLSAPCLRPRQALVVPGLLAGLPPVQIRATALDAFLHCLEAALGNPRHRLLEPLAASGMRLVRRHLPAALSGAPATSWAEPLARAALAGGLCIANARTGLIHTLSVALAAHADLPHGLLNAWLAPRVLTYNVGHYQGRLASLASEAFETQFGSDTEAAREVIAWMARLLPPDTAKLARARDFDAETVIARVRQDAGLPGVNVRPLPPGAITKLVLEIAHGAA